MRWYNKYNKTLDMMRLQKISLIKNVLSEGIIENKYEINKNFFLLESFKMH